jgi:hypothetical protein
MTAMPTRVPATAPAHFFGFEAVHLVVGGNRRTGHLICRQPFIFCKRMRHKRRGLRACCQRGSADGYSKGEFHKVTAFHDVSSWRVMQEIRRLRSITEFGSASLQITEAAGCEDV